VEESQQMVKKLNIQVTRESNKALLVSLRNLSLLVAVTAVTACSSMPEVVTGVGNHHIGYAPQDPCIRCGESWVMLPNEEMAALKISKRWEDERNGKKVSNPIDVAGPAEKIVIIE
jgi:hypothetical protein